MMREPPPPDNGEGSGQFLTDALGWVRRCTIRRLALSRLAVELRQRLLIPIMALLNDNLVKLS